MPALLDTPWHLAILDEAQAIKKPGSTADAGGEAALRDARIALTGTPVENRLGDLWSLFDFINPGLLGSAKAFSTFAKYSRTTRTIRTRRSGARAPCILRRLKTDKSVIADLPDKTEMQAFCHLTRKQAALYQQAVFELAASSSEPRV